MEKGFLRHFANLTALLCKRKMGLIKKLNKQINKFEITGDDSGLGAM